MIESKHFTYKIVEEEHLELLRKYRNDPFYRQYYREYREITCIQQKQWWLDKVVNDDSWQYFVVISKESPRIVGIAGIIYINNIDKTAESAFEFWEAELNDSQYRCEILARMTKYAFDHLNLNRVWAEVYDGKLLLGDYLDIGYKIEGVKRDVAFKNGSYTNSTICAALKDEWEGWDH